ncbi:Peptidoglycan-associated lipoprotein [subsurface metagenome]
MKENYGSRRLQPASCRGDIYGARCCLILGVFLLTGCATLGTLREVEEEKRVVEKKLGELQNSKDEEIEKLQGKVQELSVELNQLRLSHQESLKSLNKEIKILKKERDEEKETKMKVMRDLVKSEEEVKILAEEVNKLRTRLNKLIEPKIKRGEEVKKLKRETRKRLRNEKVEIREEKRGLSLVLSNIFTFKEKKVIIRKSAYSVLNKVASLLKKYPRYEVFIEGHTDDEPIRSSFYQSNRELSLVRANLVLNYLERQGVPPERLFSVGYGEYRPLASNATPAGRRKNRRVEVVILVKE